MLEESSTRAIGTYVEKILFCHNVVGAVRFLVPQTKVSEVEITMDEIQEDMDEIQHGRNFIAKVMCSNSVF